jgi:histidinol phosphatase-like PHP family hydrolase
MIDLHTHSLFSDGALLPSELIRRALVKGYRVIGISDHADASNLDFIVPRLVNVCRRVIEAWEIQAIPGVELTHIPCRHYRELTQQARELGARVVLGHGQTLVEPVVEGTNRAAIEAGVDILAHPGLISPEDTALAAERGVYLEITSRKGHSLSNGHVARLAGEKGAKLILGTDTHAPEDLITRAEAIRILLGAGIADSELKTVFQNAANLVASLFS